MCETCGQATYFSYTEDDGTENCGGCASFKAVSAAMEQADYWYEDHR